MTTLVTHLDGARAAVFESLAPDGCAPDHITASVDLQPLNRCTGHIAVYWYGVNAESGKRHQRRTSHVYAFTPEWVTLFPEADVRELIATRNCR